MESKLGSESWEFVSTAAGLRSLSLQLRPGQPVALDTEADSLYHYEEKLCLITLRQHGCTWILDPLALPDLTALWETLPDYLWIVHGADYDLRLIIKAGSRPPENVFDTMLAARLCGISPAGYAALVSKFFGQSLSKGAQKADWSQRPLPRRLLRYASQDVFYLEPLYQELRSRLLQLGRLRWLEQLYRRLVQLATRPPLLTDPLARFQHLRGLRPEGLGILHKLWEWREVEARKLDLPRFRLARDAELVALAFWAQEHGPKKPPETAFPTAQWQRYREGLLEAIQAGTKSPILRKEREAFSRPRGNDPLWEKRLRALTEKRNQIARELGLEASLIAPRAILEHLAQSATPTASELISEARWCPWQAELLGIPY
jgi:ribonuclease D